MGSFSKLSGVLLLEPLSENIIESMLVLSYCASSIDSSSLSLKLLAYESRSGISNLPLPVRLLAKNYKQGYWSLTVRILMHIPNREFLRCSYAALSFIDCWRI